MKILLSTILISLVSANIIFSQIFVENNLETNINYLVDFINSEDFSRLKTKNSDLDIIDTLYLRGLKFNNYNYSETLLALTFATLPFHKMPLHIPLTGIVLDLKLPSGDDKKIESKEKNLVKNIFFDSPKSKFGDKDKIAHFFGNAYFANSVTLFNLSKFLSVFVELFEDAFKVSGGVDNRDLIANHLGFLFGKDLRTNPDALPSQFLKQYPEIKEIFINEMVEENK